MTKKEKTEVAAPAVEIDAPMSQLILSVAHDKYRMVSLVTRWAKEIKQRDQSTLPPQEILAQSLREILGNKVTLEEIEKLPPLPKTEKKDVEFTFPTISLKEPDEEKPSSAAGTSDDQEGK